ncbi:MAG: pyruvate ferredoxin oxidoreductase subunit gamma [Candidatus Bathyarchaeota archaeon]|nr:pyruvate ferredoxin oxidoreductase subunit gamma [Candidatus Bathyarchaeota archaeon]MDW8039955.1 pyruvate ferredoxin oxidoreductase subunit gamma [Nitrososphaerota archaeon]
MLKEIRIHGRGGQGAVTAAQLLAHAAHIEGKHVQAFPYFGAERRGAPVKAFARISENPILLHSQVYNPDYVVVLDPQLYKIIDVTEGLKSNGVIVLNAAKPPDELKLGGWRVATVDATEIALELGLRIAGQPVVNTSMVGAFAGATDEVSLESVLKAIKLNWRGSAGEKNARAAELAYERLIKGW